MTAVMRCYYEVLNVAQDAEGVSIKKSYRKLALMYHPDKNAGREEEAAAEFQLVQEAYECLSDAKERQWYDEHRDMILRGVRLGEAGDGSNGADASYVFDVSPYFSTSCYNGYGDGEGGFFAVYRHAFQQIVEGEYKGWISEGNIDETLMPNAHLMDTDFGNGSKDWLELSAFYHAWESFSTSLGFAWADKYDTRDAQSRWERRRMVEENKKARKVAKRDRNENILKLVSFVKKKDPRVETARKKAKQSQLEKEEKRKKDAIQKKLDRASAKEAWMEERQKELDKLEQNDMNFGRVRLADLDDSDDEFYGKGKKKGKKGKKKKNKKNYRDNEDQDSITPNNCTAENSGINEENTGITLTKDLTDKHLNQNQNFKNDLVEGKSCNISTTFSSLAPVKLRSDQNNVEYYSDEFSEEEEEIPEIWRCEICRKDFKSEKQLENHLKSKKHREMVKKWEQKQKKKMEDEIMESLIHEIDNLSS